MQRSLVPTSSPAESHIFLWQHAVIAHRRELGQSCKSWLLPQQRVSTAQAVPALACPGAVWAAGQGAQGLHRRPQARQEAQSAVPAGDRDRERWQHSPHSTHGTRPRNYLQDGSKVNAGEKAGLRWNRLPTTQDWRCLTCRSRVIRHHVSRKKRDISNFFDSVFFHCWISSTLAFRSTWYSVLKLQDMILLEMHLIQSSSISFPFSDKLNVGKMLLITVLNNIACLTSWNSSLLPEQIIQHTLLIPFTHVPSAGLTDRHTLWQ